MAAWDVVETDFGSDETGNFGPRQESGTALYQIDTVATISPRQKEDYTGQPSVVSAVLGDCGCVAADRHVSIFKDCQFSVTLEFNSIVEAVAWSPDGLLLVVCDDKGILYLFDANSLENIFSFAVLQQSSNDDTATFKKILFNDKREGVYDLLILAGDGKICILANINPAVFADAQNLGPELMKKLQFELIETKDTHIATCDDVIGWTDSMITLGSGDNVICVWNFENEKWQPNIEISEEYCDAMVKGCVTSDGNFLITLSIKGTLSVWCAHMLIEIYQCTDLAVADFQLLVMKEPNNNSLQDMKLVVMTSADENGCSLQVLSLPTFEVTYALQLNSSTSLAHCSPSQEAIFVAEGCASQTASNIGAVNTLRWRCITETNPETRLYRYLRKNMFDEAENFAKLFGLDIAMVKKMNVNYLLDQLSPWNSPNYENKLDTMIDQLWACLALIKDDVYIAETCVRAALPTFESTMQLLTYAKNRVTKYLASSRSSSDKGKLQSLLSKLMDARHRLTTFQMAYGISQYSGDVWDRFQKVAILTEVQHSLDRGNVGVAFTIWARHASECEHKFTPAIVRNILGAIPDHVPASQTQMWLNNFIPYVGRLLPKQLSTVVEWIVGRASFMEMNEREEWPQNALEYLHTLYNTCETMMNITTDSSYSIPQESVNRTTVNMRAIFEPLEKLILSLQNLHELHTIYKCKLTYAQFSQETVETVAFRMLDKVVSLELIVPTLEKQIRPYMKAHNLKEDHVFSKYVIDLLERMGRVTRHGESPWETKVIGIIACITEPKRKCSSILKVLQEATVPWSREIEKLAEEGLKMNHPIVSDIQNQCQLTELKKIMITYEMHCTVPVRRNAQRMIYFILNKDTATCVDDALQVMKLYEMETSVDLYCFRMRQLIKLNRMDEALELVKTLPQDIAVDCIQHIIGFTIVFINTTVSFDDAKDERLLFMSAAIILSEFVLKLQTDHFEIEENVKMLQKLRNIRALQVEFNENVLPDEYDSKVYRQQLMENYKTRFFTEGKNEDVGSGNLSKIYRLAEILMIPHHQLQTELAVHASKLGMMEAAMDTFNTLLASAPTKDTCVALHDVALHLIKLLPSHSSGGGDEGISNKLKLASITHQLASNALTFCDEEHLLVYLDLCKLTSVIHDISRQCEASNYGMYLQEQKSGGSGNSKRDPYQVWTFTTMYKDDAPILDWNALEPMLAQFIHSHRAAVCESENITDGNNDESDGMSDLSNAGMDLVHFLEQNDHFELSFHCLSMFTSTCTQYTHRNSMGYPKYIQNEKQQTKLAHLEQQAICEKVKILPSLIFKMFNYYNVDHSLGLAYSMNLPVNKAINIIKKSIRDAGQNFKKLQAVAKVGIAIGELHGIVEMQKMCNDVATKADWGHRLSKLKINCNKAFDGSLAIKLQLLSQIAKSEDTDQDFIKEYCKSFQIDLDDGLLLYLNCLLLEQSLNKSSLLKAKNVIAEIQGTERLLSKLEEILRQVDSYDYETLQFLLEEIDKLQGSPETEKGVRLLEYLRIYKRRTPASTYECQYRHVDDDEEGQIMDQLSCLSKDRLPYHALMDKDPWKIINPELTVESVDYWLPIAGLLKLPKDQLYVMTVKNVVNKHLEINKLTSKSNRDKSKCVWDLNEANVDFLNSIQNLLMSVKTSKLTMSCSNWVMSQLPIGADKVLAFKEVVSYAEKWYQSCSEGSTEKEEALIAFNRFSSVYQRVSIEQILYLNKMAEKEYTMLAGKPTQLIEKLFDHPSITKVGRLNQEDKPDIHSIAARIAEENKLNLTDIRDVLLEKWLPLQASKLDDTDITMTFNMDKLNLSADNQMSEDDENLRRVIYLMQTDDLDRSIHQLYTFAVEADTGVSSMSRVRALQCVFEIADDATILEVTKQPPDEIRKYLQCLMYIVDLDKLHVQHSIKSFQECNKETLVKGIWRNHSHQKTAVNLVASICFHYKIFDVELWCSVLQQLYSQGLYEHLGHALVRLAGHPEIWQIYTYPKMWQAVVMDILSRGVVPLTDSQVKESLYAYDLLQRCPVFRDLDLITISRQYQQLEMLPCALGCLLITSNTKRDQMIEAFYANGVQVILDDLDNLSKRGMTVTSVQQIREHIYLVINSNALYEEIEGTSHQHQFVQYLIKNRSIDGLLEYGLKNGRIEEAMALFKSYYASYPEMKRLAKMADADNPYDLLKVYLEVQGLQDMADCFAEDTCTLNVNGAI